MKIGDKIYKYLSFNGFATYIVLAEIKREKAKLYEVECQACKHGEKCRLLVAKKSKGVYRYCSMVNEDEETNEHQYYWHDDSLFYESLIEARKSVYLECIEKKKKELEKAEKNLEATKKALAELNEHYTNLSPQ